MINNLWKRIQNDPLIKKAFVDTNYYFISLSGIKLVSLIVIPILARIITVEEFATYDLFLLTSSFLTTIIGLGIDSGFAIIISEERDNKSLLSSLFSFSLILSTLLVLIFWALAFLISRVFEQEFFTPTLLHFLMAYLLFTYLNYAIFNFLRWLGDAKKAAILNLICSSFGVILGIVLITRAATPKLELYIFGLLIGTGVGALFSIYIVRNWLTTRFDNDFKTKVRELLNLSLPFVPNYLANYFMLYIDRFIILALLGNYALGIYSLASRFAQIPRFFVDVLTRGVRPVLFLNYQTESGAKLNRNIIHFLTFSFIPVFFLAFILAKPMILIFGGEKYLESAEIIPFLILSVIIFSSMGLNGFGYSIKRKTIQIFYISVLSIILNLVFSIGLGHFFGLVGVAFGTLIATTIGAFLYTYYSEKLYSFKYNTKLILAVYTALLILCFFIIFPA